MKNIVLLATVFFMLIMSGCATKRKYFEPSQVDGEITHSATISNIQSVVRNAATLADLKFISDDGIGDISLEKNDVLLNRVDDKFIVSNLDGTLKIINKNKVVYTTKLARQSVAANMKGSNLAVVDADNTIYLIDTANNAIKMQYSAGTYYGIDSRVANPIFVDNVLIYPTLDGKIIIADSDGNIARNVVIGGSTFFNNIIFLHVFADKVYAATGSRLMLISQNKTKIIDGQIRDILIGDNQIFLLQKDGTIDVFDMELEKIASKNFKFAIFSQAALKDGFLYIIERTGYLIKVSSDLKQAQVYKFDNDRKDKVFSVKNQLYYGQKIFQIQ